MSNHKYDYKEEIDENIEKKIHKYDYKEEIDEEFNPDHKKYKLDTLRA